MIIESAGSIGKVEWTSPGLPGTKFEDETNIALSSERMMTVTRSRKIWTL